MENITQRRGSKEDNKDKIEDIREKGQTYKRKVRRKQVEETRNNRYNNIYKREEKT